MSPKLEVTTATILPFHRPIGDHCPIILDITTASPIGDHIQKIVPVIARKLNSKVVGPWGKYVTELDWKARYHKLDTKLTHAETIMNDSPTPVTRYR